MPGPQPGPADIFPDPPAVAITPCDPWPRPYYFEDGLRRVTPYHYTYNTNCKERWRGRELLEIFEDEFRDRPGEYYKDAILTNQIVINGKPVLPTHRIKNGDIVSHTTHRHEPPVSATPIKIINESEDLIVISKPSGIPVHPAGRYHYNSIVEILRSSRGPDFNPLPCNRLDRLTSGVMFLAKHKAAADEMTRQIMARTVKKEYLARVAGEFPEGKVVCEQPMLQISAKLGLNRVRANGKEARTVFVRLAYYPPKEEEDGRPEERRNGDGSEKEEPAEVDPTKPWLSHRGYSIVHCLPLTGRTHQIRVHLQYLGHPITNDPIYSSQRIFGIDLGRGDSTSANDESILSRLSLLGKSEVASALSYHSELVDTYNARKSEKMNGLLCDVCQTPLYSDPGEHELGIYLHALRYADAGGKWSFQSELPDWAGPPDSGEDEGWREALGARLDEARRKEEVEVRKNEERVEGEKVEVEVNGQGKEGRDDTVSNISGQSRFVLGTHPG